MEREDYNIPDEHERYMPGWEEPKEEPVAKAALIAPETTAESAQASGASTAETSDTSDASAKAKKGASEEASAAKAEKSRGNTIVSLARWFSALFSPLLAGTYGIIIAFGLSFLCYSPFKAKAIVTVMTFVSTCIVPVIVIFLLSRMGVVKDPALNRKEDRLWPYLITGFCYLATGVYYHSIKAPEWLAVFMCGAALALWILAATTRRWKISGHSCGVGALVALIYYLMSSGNSVSSLRWEFAVMVLVAGCVMTSRLILERHTLWQVLVGFVLGFAAVFTPTWILQGESLPPMPF